MAPGPASGSGYKPAGMPRSTPGGSPGAAGPGRSGSGGAPSWQWGTNKPSPNKGVAPRTQSYKGRGNPYKGNSSPTTQPGGAPRPSTPEAKRQARQQARDPGTNGASKRGAKGNYRANPPSKNAANKAAGTAKAAKAAGAAGIPAAAAKAGVSKGAIAGAGSRRVPIAAAGLFGVASGESLRRRLAKNNPDLQYPSNTPALLGDPAGTIRDGARGLRESWREPAQTLREGLEGLNNAMNDIYAKPVTPAEITEGTPPGYTAPSGPPPFTGGQSPGVLYRVEYRYWFNNPLISGRPEANNGYGPIQIKTTNTDGTNHSIFGNGVDIRGNSASFDPQVAGSGLRIDSITRVDGQPDTGGDPLGKLSPITAPPPVRASPPAVASPPTDSPTDSPPQTKPPSPQPPRELPGRPPARKSPPQTPPLETPPETPPKTSPPPQPVIPGDPQGVPKGPDRDPEQDLNPQQQPGTNGGTAGQTAPAVPPIPGRAGNTPSRTTFQRPGKGSPPTGSSNPPQTARPPVRTTSPPGCRGCGGSISNSLGDINANQINLGNNIAPPTDLTPVLANQVIMMGNLSTILQRLGSQITGGIGPFMETAFKATRVDKVLNAMNTILIIHNAAMLSRSVGQSLGELASLALSLFGVKDEKDAPIDVNEVLGNAFENVVKSVLGDELYTTTTKNWAKLSAVWSAAANITSTIRSITDSTREVLEWTAENTGKIGNALKTWRVVGEDAYKWMPEKVQAQGKWASKVRGVQEGVESLDDAASSLTGVLSEVKSIQEEFDEADEQTTKFNQALKDALPKERVDNDAKKDANTQSKAASASPELTAASRKKGDET